MHILVNQRLQEVASYKRDKLFPEEIDLALNQAMERFIKRNVDVRFQNRQSKLSNIDQLAEKNVALDVIIPALSDYNYEPNVGILELPPNYQYLVNGRVATLKTTIEPNCNVAPILGTTTKTEYVTKVLFPEPVAGSGPYYTNFSIRTGSIFTSSSSKYLLNMVAFPYDKEYKSLVISNVLESINVTSGYPRVYWERYRNTYEKNTFIFVDNITPVKYWVTTFAADGTTIDKQEVGLPATQTAIIYNQGLLTPTYLTGKKLDNVPFELTEGDIAYNTLKLNVFTQTKDYQPTVVQARSLMYIYRDESFLITKAYLDYIRKPVQISLALNQSCELDSYSHREIVDLAVEILKLDIRDPSYQAMVQNTENRTKN